MMRLTGTWPLPVQSALQLPSQQSTLQDERMLLKTIVQTRHTERLVLAVMQVQQVLQLVSILLVGG
jgi:hypothetical protein